MGVIELDRTGPVASRRHSHHARWVVVLLLCASVLTGSARALPDPLVLLWSVPADAGSSIAATASSVYLAHGARISAYDLVGGRLRWTRPIAVSGLAVTATDGGAVLVPVGRTAVRYQADYGQVVVEGVTDATPADCSVRSAGPPAGVQSAS